MTDRLRDVEVWLEDRPGTLAQLGEVLGHEGISLEGGGMFRHAGTGIAHFLVDDGDAARRALAKAGLDVRAVSEVVLLRLDQGTSGQLGTLCRKMADAGVDIGVQYSDHEHRLVLVVDDEHLPAARQLADRWSSVAGPNHRDDGQVGGRG